MMAHLQSYKNVTSKIFGTLFVFAFLIMENSNAQSLPNGEVITSGTYTVPQGVTKIRVEAIGGGGAGGYSASSGQTTGGGGGGAYSQVSELSVTPGEALTIYIGGGGSGASGNSAGGNTYMQRSGINLILAVGGSGVNDNSTVGGAGGQANNCIGDIRYSGGNGGNGNGDGGLGYHSGGGGGAAGRTGGGGNGAGSSSSAGGAGNSPGGNGGIGARAAFVASPPAGGSSFGGAGGGGKRPNTGGGEAPAIGGSGAAGVIIITYICASEYDVTSTVSSVTTACQNAANLYTNLTFTGTAASLPAGTYTVSYIINEIGYNADGIVVTENAGITTGIISNIPVPTATAGDVVIAIESFENSIGCTDAIDHNQAVITIYPTPVASIKQDDEVCEGAEVTLTFTLETGTPPWSVKFADNEEGLNAIDLQNINDLTIEYDVTLPVGNTTYHIIEVKDDHCPPQI